MSFLKSLLATVLLFPLLAMAATKTVVVDATTEVLSGPTNYLNTNFISKKIIRVNKQTGDDSTARAYTTKAFSNIYTAASNSVAGDTLIADPSDYPLLNITNAIKLPNGVSLAGTPGQTFISVTNNDSNTGLLFPGNDSKIYGIHFRGYTPATSGGILKLITTALPGSGTKYWFNAVFQACTFEGQTDTYAPVGAQPVDAKFWNCLFTGYWDAILQGGSPNYGEWNYCRFVFNSARRGNVDSAQIDADWSATAYQPSSGSTGIFNYCSFVFTNTGLPTLKVDINAPMGAHILRDASGTGYHTNWTVFNKCDFGCAGTNGSTDTNFGSTMFSGLTTNGWMNSNNVIKFNGDLPQTYYPPSYGMYEANTYCASWGDGIIMAPNASTRIIRLPNAGPSAMPYFDGEQLEVVDFGGTATGTNITISTRGGQTIDGNATVAITLNGSRKRFRVVGTNWVTVLTTDFSSAGTAAAGGSARIQFAQGTALAGTNDLVWDRTNNLLNVNGVISSAGVNATGTVTILSTSAASGKLTLNSSNGVGGIVYTPQHNLPVIITNVFNGTNFTPGWQWFVSASNNNLITWTSGPPASASSGSGTNLDHSPLANAKRWAYVNCAGGNSYQTIGDTFASAGGSASAFTPDANNPVGVTWTTAAAADALMGSAGNSIFMPTYNPDFSAAVSIPITNQTRMWIGLTGGSGGTAAQSTNMSPSSLHCAAFRFFSTNSANWFAVTADGSTINAVDTGITVSTNYMVFRIKKVGSTWVFHTNDVPVMTNSANLPTAVMHTSVYGSSSENNAKVHTAHWVYVQTDK